MGATKESPLLDSWVPPETNNTLSPPERVRYGNVTEQFGLMRSKRSQSKEVLEKMKRDELPIAMEAVQKLNITIPRLVVDGESNFLEQERNTNNNLNGSWSNSSIKLDHLILSARGGERLKTQYDDDPPSHPSHPVPSQFSPPNYY